MDHRNHAEPHRTLKLRQDVHRTQHEAERTHRLRYPTARQQHQTACLMLDQNEIRDPS